MKDADESDLNKHKISRKNLRVGKHMRNAKSYTPKNELLNRDQGVTPGSSNSSGCPLADIIIISVPIGIRVIEGNYWIRV